MITWEFNKDVASRFLSEASNHIPDYFKVIQICLEYAQFYPKSATILDIGSALGETVFTFKNSGYFNTYGVDSSIDMIRASRYPDSTIHSSTMPKILCDLVLFNWTLHFIKEKQEYLRDVFNNLHTNGTLILTDKTAQTANIKNLYYSFKQKNGVTDNYILEKEKMLVHSMYIKDFSWYTETLHEIGFASVEVVNAKYGFVTFVCQK
jgi:trans-aconitate methyltransferase